MSEKFVHRENRGSLFNNDRKESENNPDLKGSINVEGKLYWISAWQQEKYLSLSVQPQEQKQESSAEEQDIPF